MSQAALDAYLDYGEGYPDCPACGDNSYVHPALATDLGGLVGDSGASISKYPRGVTIPKGGFDTQP